jgi:V8-like Glu-specific endopeptidase
MRKLIAGTVTTVALLVAATPAPAITNGTDDGNGHPEVGMMLAPQVHSDGTWTRCTGTLISSTVFLTAAHCEIPGATQVKVTFDSAFTFPGTTYTGTWHADPAFSQSQGDPHDIAVIVLNTSPGITPAVLPGAGSNEGLSKNQKFTSVGYGTSAAVNGPGGHTFPIDDVRHVAVGTLNSVTKSFLRISQNASHGDGGTCYGDSGGPNFLGAGATETNVIAAITITGDTACRSTNVDYRLDTASARGFLANYVSVP